MGYDVFITRREIWSDEDGPDITLSDWLAYLSIDPSLQRDAQFDSGRGSSNGGYQEPTHVIWTEWPGQGDGKEARFYLEDGNVVAKDTDAAIRQKLFVMAHVLEGKLQGAKGETYNSIGENDKKGRRRSKQAPGQEKSWWRFW